MSRFTDLLGDPKAEKRFLAILEPYDPAASTVRTIYLSTHGFITEPGETPANTYFEPRLNRPYSFTRSLFSSGKLGGRSLPGAGAVVLNNGDGGLDILATYAWGGRRVRVYLGGDGFALADYGLIFEGTAQGLAYADGEITVNLRDLAYVFEREIQPSQFAGTGGAEGSSDLTGKRKPLGYGILRNVEPIFLGASAGLNRYAFGTGASVGVLAVYDRGVPLTYAASPAPGQWSVDLATSTITLGGTANGPLTADVIGRRYLTATSSTSNTVGTGSKTFAVATGLALAVGMRLRIARTADLAGTSMDGLITAYSGTSLTVTVDGSRGSGTYTDWTISPWGTVAGILRDIAVGMGVTVFDTAALAALDTVQPATIGYWIPEGGTGGVILDAIADGTGAYWGFDRGGQFEAGRVDVPGTPLAAYDASQVLSLERLATEEPSWQVLVRYRRNWRPLSTDQLAGVALANQTAFVTEWRTATAQSAAVQTAYPLSKPLQVDSLFDEPAAAQAEAARLLTLFAARRDYFRARLKVQPLATENGDTTLIMHPRYGLAAGKALRAIDVTFDMDAYEVELGLWG
ncbi:hypothetical protein [Methylobacterium sp. Leaf118]|uniref:hypothetical protein n=1 Tax=Methylobacterium sp. Leaf118 TaxID=2876562 RepID=UPI001E47242F|nr:hypothetical protein [Methylobacterium sp. Leaf118]